MSLILPVPAAVLKPLAQQALKLAKDRVAKGNPLVGALLTTAGHLIDQHHEVPAELAPVRRQITAALAADFAGMEGAFARAEEAGKFKGG